MSGNILSYAGATSVSDCLLPCGAPCYRADQWQLEYSLTHDKRGDGTCQASCNTAECNFDYDDCSTASKTIPCEIALQKETTQGYGAFSSTYVALTTGCQCNQSSTTNDCKTSKFCYDLNGEYNDAYTFNKSKLKCYDYKLDQRFCGDTRGVLKWGQKVTPYFCGNAPSAPADTPCGDGTYDGNSQCDDAKCCLAVCSPVQHGTCSTCTTNGCTAIICNVGHENTNQEISDGCEKKVNVPYAVDHIIKLFGMWPYTFNGNPNIVKSVSMLFDVVLFCGGGGKFSCEI